MEEDLTVLVEGGAGVTWLLGALEGTFAGAPFAARLRYTRTWETTAGVSWPPTLARCDGDSPQLRMILTHGSRGVSGSRGASSVVGHGLS